MKCPRCEIGEDSDGDGDCAVCARMSDEQVARAKASQPAFPIGIGRTVTQAEIARQWGDLANGSSYRFGR